MKQVQLFRGTCNNAITVQLVMIHATWLKDLCSNPSAKSFFCYIFISNRTRKIISRDMQWSHCGPFGLDARVSTHRPELEPKQQIFFIIFLFFLCNYNKKYYSFIISVLGFTAHRILLFHCFTIHCTFYLFFIWFWNITYLDQVELSDVFIYILLLGRPFTYMHMAFVIVYKLKASETRSK